MNISTLTTRREILDIAAAVFSETHTLYMVMQVSDVDRQVIKVVHPSRRNNHPAIFDVSHLVARVIERNYDAHAGGVVMSGISVKAGQVIADELSEAITGAPGEFHYEFL